jgi:hypothetical protein
MLRRVRVRSLKLTLLPRWIAVLFVFLFAGMLLPLLALAEGPHYSLIVRGPDGCVTRGQFLDEVLRRTSRFAIAEGESPDIRFDVAIEKKGQRLVATLITDREGRRTTRQLEGQSCEELVGALSFMVAFTVDPLAKAVPEPTPTGTGTGVTPTPPSTSPSSTPPPVPTPPAVVLPPRPPWVRTPYGFTADEGPATPLPAVAESEPSSLGVGVGAGFRLDGGLFSHPLLGAEFGAYLHGGVDPWLVGVSGAVMATPLGAFGGAEVTGQVILGVAQATGCPWGGIFGPITLRPCATLAFGGLQGDFGDLGGGLGGYLALAPEGRVGWIPISWFALEGTLRLLIPLVSPRFLAGEAQVVAPNQVGVSGVVGATFLP